MRDSKLEIPGLERGFEAVGWMLTAALLAGAFLLPEASSWPARARLIAVAVALGAANLLAHRLTSAAARSAFIYGSDDRALAITFGEVALVTSYIYFLPGGPPALAYLYLLPLIGAAMVLEARVVLAEASLSILAMLFIQAAAAGPGGFWTPELVVRIAVFSSVAACLAAAASRMRESSARVESRSIDLSRRLELTRAIEALARQGELAPDIDRLAEGAGAIIAEAVGSLRHAMFIVDRRHGGDLEAVGESDASARLDREMLATSENASLLMGVLETGVARMIDSEAAEGDTGARGRGLLAVQLRVRQTPIGVMCLLDRRADGGFSPEDVALCETLSGIAAPLLNCALLLRQAHDERRISERVSKLMIGRETRLSELKARLAEKRTL